jgi:hypothetical protein
VCPVRPGASAWSRRPLLLRRPRRPRRAWCAPWTLHPPAAALPIVVLHFSLANGAFQPFNYGGLPWSSPNTPYTAGLGMADGSCSNPPQPAGRSGGRALFFDPSFTQAGTVTSATYGVDIGSSGGPRFDLLSIFVKPLAARDLTNVQFKALRNGSPVGTTVTLPNLLSSLGFQKVQFTPDFQDIDRVEITYTASGSTFEKPCQWSRFKLPVVLFCQPECGKQP